MTPYQIIICGQSIFLTAIEASLANLPEFVVKRLALSYPGLVERIAAMEPDLILLEGFNGHGELALALLNRGLALLELHPQSGQVTLLSGRQHSITEPKELLQLIKATESHQR